MKSLYLPHFERHLLQDCPPNLRHWLTSTGSLTARIEQATGQKLHVVPTFEGRQTIDLSEKIQLHQPLNRPCSAWVREAQLYGRVGEPAWIEARSVFVFDSLVGGGRQLANLGKRPIGYVIFGRHGASLHQRYYQLTDKGWQRTSIYQWKNKFLLISEIFLQSFDSDLTK